MQSKTIMMAGGAVASLALVAYAAVLSTGSDSDPTPSASESSDAATPLAARPRGSASAGPARRFAPRRAGVGIQPASLDEASAPDLPSEARIAEMIRHEQEREETFVAQFDAESVDAQWAARWESGIHAALESNLADLPGFGSIDVECRHSRCLAEASWENYAAATLSLSMAADVTKGACATSVFMPPPDDPDAPYRHTLRFSSCQDAPS